MNHIDDDALADYVLSEAREDRASSAVASHLKECEQCHTRFRATAAFFEALTTADVWQEADRIRAVTDDDEHKVLEFAARCQREYLDARAALGPLLDEPVAFIRERVERHARYVTAGAVRVLSEAANAACERSPLHARRLAEAAVAIAQQLSADDYSQDTVDGLRGLAWKECANALRFLAEYPAALDAVDRAERAFSRRGPGAYEMGGLAYIRAVIFTYMDRLDEATRQAQESARISAAYGDMKAWIRARSVEAGVLFYRREFPLAADAFAQLRAYAESNEDLIGMARHSYHVATCFLELGDARGALPLLLDARKTFAERHVTTDLIATDWKLGVLARVAGNFEASVAQLRTTSESAEQLGLPEEAAHITLDLIESLLLLGRNRELSRLCSQVMRYFRTSGKLRQALTAAAFLKEAATQGNLRVDSVRHVRSFVERLERQPDLLFAPPSY
jgi:tetratricopeptide (TPR) repeat protein